MHGGFLFFFFFWSCPNPQKHSEKGCGAALPFLGMGWLEGKQILAPISAPPPPLASLSSSSPAATYRTWDRKLYRGNKRSLNQQSGGKRRVNEKEKIASELRMTYQIEEQNSQWRKWRQCHWKTNLKGCPRIKRTMTETKLTREWGIALLKQEQSSNIEIITIPEFLKMKRKGPSIGKIHWDEKICKNSLREHTTLQVKNKKKFIPSKYSPAKIIMMMMDAPGESWSSLGEQAELSSAKLFMDAINRKTFSDIQGLFKKHPYVSFYKNKSTCETITIKSSSMSTRGVKGTHCFPHIVVQGSDRKSRAGFNFWCRY